MCLSSATVLIIAERCEENQSSNITKDQLFSLMQSLEIHVTPEEFGEWCQHINKFKPTHVPRAATVAVFTIPPGTLLLTGSRYFLARYRC